ncbi:MAG: LamG-like jellyroll fold domain-containing protein [Phycisphaeraceae bacterium]
MRVKTQPMQLAALSILAGILAAPLAVQADSFSPQDISGLQVWLKADILPGLGHANGQGVTVWPDSSSAPNSLGVAQAGSSLPTHQSNVLNGQSVVRFTNSTANHLQEMRLLDAPNGTWQSWSSLQITGGLTFFAVINPTADGNGPLMSDENGTLRPGLAKTTETSTFRHANSVLGPGINSFRILAATQSNVAAEASNDMALFLDGTLQNSATNTNSTLSNTNKVMLGADIFNLPNRANFSGDVAEILIYNSVLSEAQRDLVGAYLADKYALTWVVVPEPSAMSLLLCCGLVLSTRRGRHESR